MITVTSPQRFRFEEDHLTVLAKRCRTIRNLPNRGQNFTVNQNNGCVHVHRDANVFQFVERVQTQTIAVTTQPTCTVQATSEASWIDITDTPPAGGGNVI